MPIKITIQEEEQEKPKKKSRKKSSAKKRSTKTSRPKKKTTIKVEGEKNETNEKREDNLAEQKAKVIKVIEDNNKENENYEKDNNDFKEAQNNNQNKDKVIVLKDSKDFNQEEEKVIDFEEDEKPHQRYSLKLYRRIAFSFIFLTIILLGVIFYFSFVKVSIVLIPNQERITNNLIFDVYDKGIDNRVSGAAIKGVVKEIELSYEDIYPATGENVIGEEVVGKAVIINNYYKNQPLVATTRLLTPDNKLFRIKETVNVPAGGEVEVEIYADEPSKDMVIGPTKFIIPGLWAGLQDKIYAISKEPTQYKQKVRKYVQDVDIENATRDLKQKLLSKAKKEISSSYQEYDQLIYDIDEDSVVVDIDAKKGDEVDEFSAKIKAKVVLVGFKNKEAAHLAKQKFISSLPSNKELIEFDDNNIIYSLSSCDCDSGVASINAVFEGRVSLKDNVDIVDVNKILGLNKEQLEAYLSSLPDIAGFEIKFYPSFIKTVPNLVDRVHIEIKK